MEVRCCCDGSRVRGLLPEDSDALPKRELDDGTFAFSSENMDDEELIGINGFAPVLGKKGKPIKTWRK